MNRAFNFIAFYTVSVICRIVLKRERESRERERERESEIKRKRK